VVMRMSEFRSLTRCRIRFYMDGKGGEINLSNKKTKKGFDDRHRSLQQVTGTEVCLFFFHF